MPFTRSAVEVVGRRVTVVFVGGEGPGGFLVEWFAVFALGVEEGEMAAGSIGGGG